MCCRLQATQFIFERLVLVAGGDGQQAQAQAVPHGFAGRRDGLVGVRAHTEKLP